MEGYREMGEIPWKKKFLKYIFRQPGNSHFWKFIFGVNCGGSGTSRSRQNTNSHTKSILEEDLRKIRFD